MPDGYSILNNAGEGTGTLLVTDEEDENDTRHWPDETRSMSPSVGEDVVRTGEASRLRRRGAVHGRRPQLSYVSLICGAPLPWRFKFKESYGVEPKRTSSLRSLNQRYESLKSHPSSSKDLTLEFPSTGCRSTLTSRAYVSSSHQVYSASAPLQNVAIVNKSYLDEEQKRTVVELLVDSWGQFDWQGSMSNDSGNIIGFRYAPATFDEQGTPIDNCMGPSGYMPKERFAFFPSAITSSKPYDFTTQQHYSNSYHWRYLEPLSTTTTTINFYSRPSEYSPRNQDCDNGDARPFQYHHPTSFLQGRSDTIIDPRTSLSILSVPPSISPLDPIHHGAWDDPLSRASHEPQLQPDNSWATWYPDPAYATDDDEEHIGEIELSEAISILRTTHGDIVPRLQLPLAPSSDQSYTIDHAVAMYHSEEEDVSRMRASSDLLLQGQHAPNVPQVGDEHVAFGSNTPPVLIEEQTSSDNQHGYAQMDFTPIPEQRRSLTLPDVLMLDDLHADDSQVHDESERVHDIIFQEPDSTPVMQQDAEIEQMPEQVSANSTNIFTISSTSTLPTPLPIAYESPATIVDVEGNNERTDEMENVGILVEVPPPPLSSTSEFGSAVIVPSLVDPAGIGSSPRPVTSDSFPTSLYLPIQPIHSVEDSNNDVPGNSVAPSNAPSQRVDEPDNAVILDVKDEFPSSIPSVSYQLYTPPLPLSTPQALAPSLPPSPSPSSSILPSDSFPLLTFADPIEDESPWDGIHAEVPVLADTDDLETGSPPNFATAVSTLRNDNDVLQSHFEEAGLSEHGLRNETSRSTIDDSPVASQSHPDPSPPSPTDLAITAPASQPQPLPENSPAHTSRETIPMLSLVSRRLSDYASPTSSASSQRRSSSRRSWRTPRELLESPQSAGPVNEDDASVSVSRSHRELSSVSRGGTDYGGETRSSASARRIRGDSRIRRRRLSSSSRRESRISATSAFYNPPSDTMRFSGRSQVSTTTSGIQFQQRIGDILHRFPGINPSPELIRRGSLPNIDRPRLTNLVRRDSLPVLSIMRREPLTDLTTTFQQRGPMSSAIGVPDSSHPRSRPSTRHRSAVSVRHHGYERPGYELSNPQLHQYDAEHEERLVSEHESNAINNDNSDPEEALTPRPRRHATMPVFIPTPPSDSDSESEDNIQNGERMSNRRGSNPVPWMPWEWCWQDQRRIPLESGLQIEVHTTQLLPESDKEDE
ncbi:hypothetical protein Clacol_001050 [Clathrus columnatus]|uniref:Uncharacterized protein n=1 Tax=Clathrus columnatus TaxID=1419009 RepID=A0AAV4ZXK9_9AGAM|nr:hypothetical protein Clacol_001050 [Clathrus columnatus]